MPAEHKMKNVPVLLPKGLSADDFDSGPHSGDNKVSAKASIRIWTMATLPSTEQEADSAEPGQCGITCTLDIISQSASALPLCAKLLRQL